MENERRSLLTCLRDAVVLAREQPTSRIGCRQEISMITVIQERALYDFILHSDPPEFRERWAAQKAFEDEYRRDTGREWTAYFPRRSPWLFKWPAEHRGQVGLAFSQSSALCPHRPQGPRGPLFAASSYSPPWNSTDVDSTACGSLNRLMAVLRSWLPEKTRTRNEQHWLFR